MPTKKEQKDMAWEFLPTLIDIRPTPAPQPPVRRLLNGRYEILSEIGRGGFGVVYCARQIGLDRLVAVKSLLGAHHTHEACQRFLREIHVVKQLIHPHSIHLYDIGQDEEGRWYYVMELLEGETLGACLAREQRLGESRACHITRQILKSIAEAHDAGILHRDIKPANTFLRRVPGEEDFVKVLDFGIAKPLFSQPLDAAHALTQEGMVIGTPRYLAPEYFRREKVGMYSDIYSIGLMLYEMLVGTLPMPEGALDIMKFHLSRQILPLPRAYQRSAIGRILRRATHTNPHKRYPSCAAFLADIDRLQGAKAPRARPRAHRALSDEPKAHHLVWGIALLFLMLAALVWLLHSQQPTSESAAPPLDHALLLIE